MKIQSKVMRKMWSIKHLFSSISEALRVAWKIVKITNQMNLGFCEFYFKKINGEIRKAIGTFNKEYVHKGSINFNDETFSYWDVEKKGFRSFRIDMLV